MGIKIDDIIQSLTAMKSVIGVNQLTINEAIETMHKYQRIQEIVKQKDYDRFNSHNYYGYFLRVQDIKKVVEDGNDKS